MFHHDTSSPIRSLVINSGVKVMGSIQHQISCFSYKMNAMIDYWLIIMLKRVKRKGKRRRGETICIWLIVVDIIVHNTKYFPVLYFRAKQRPRWYLEIFRKYKEIIWVKINPQNASKVKVFLRKYRSKLRRK